MSYKFDVVVENGKEDPTDNSVPSQIQQLHMSHNGHAARIRRNN